MRFNFIWEFSNLSRISRREKLRKLIFFPSLAVSKQEDFSSVFLLLFKKPWILLTLENKRVEMETKEKKIKSLLFRLLLREKAKPPKNKRRLIIIFSVIFLFRFRKLTIRTFSEKKENKMKTIERLKLKIHFSGPSTLNEAKLCERVSVVFVCSSMGRVEEVMRYGDSSMNLKLLFMPSRPRNTLQWISPLQFQTFPEIIQ